jgi:DNA-binding response OmpR family regulator
MSKVLVAEDDHDIAEPLARALRREGHEVEICGDGPTALEAARSGTADLLVLDLGLPGMDGLDVCRALRAGGHDLPVLMRTARNDEVDAVVGLDAGADDYVSKPFRVGELLARVRAQLRRSAGSALVVQGVRVDPESRRAWVDEAEITLTAKEFELLRLLVQEAGTVVPRERIMREVWETDWWGSSKTLDMHVSWLRRKLGDDASRPHYITTVRGVGLRFERG